MASTLASFPGRWHWSRRLRVALAIRSLGSACLLLACAIGLRSARGEDPNKPPKPLKLCLVSGSLEYKSDESLDAFAQYVERNYHVACSKAYRRQDDDLPGLENLDSCDCVLLFTRRLTISGDQLERVKKYCQSGKPLVGVRTASHAFQNWLALDKEVLGGNYQGHYESGPVTEITIDEAAKEHPILSGFKPFGSNASLYKNTGLAEDAQVLLRGTIPDHVEPLAWTRVHEGGRVFYTSLGHPDDFAQDEFLRLLTRAVFWTCDREVAAREE